MRPGPIPDPTALQKLKGNSSSRVNSKKFKQETKVEPEPGCASTEVPKELKGDRVAQYEWKRLAPELANLGMLTVLDTHTLMAYCVAYSQWRSLKDRWAADLVADETDRGVRTVSVETRVMMDLYRTMLSYITQLGLSPAARTRVRVEKPQHLIDPKPKNDYFMN